MPAFDAVLGSHKHLSIRIPGKSIGALLVAGVMLFLEIFEELDVSKINSLLVLEPHFCC